MDVLEAIASYVACMHVNALAAFGWLDALIMGVATIYVYK